MRYSFTFIIISIIFVVASFVEYMVFESRYYYQERLSECYIIRANSDFFQKLVNDGKSKNGFHKYPALVFIPKSIEDKYHFGQVEFACFDSIQCNNYFFHFDCAKSNDIYYLALRNYHEIGVSERSYELYDGRNNMIKTLSAVHTFEKNVLSNIGPYKTDIPKRIACIYAEVFFWNQIYIYIFIFFFGIMLMVVETKILR